MTTEREELLRYLAKEFLRCCDNRDFHVSVGNIAISQRFQLMIRQAEELVYFHGFTDSEFKDMLLELEPYEEETE